MARRYAQVCPVARSLDLLGSRWTLLIVRDLLLGPLRFSDLLERLPGIGRNLLTQRLAELLEEGLLTRRKLPAPASSWVYELTEAGSELGEPLAALARWGRKHGARPPEEDDHLEPDLMGLALAMAADSALGADLEEEHEFSVSGAVFHLSWSRGRVRARRGAAHAPCIRLEIQAPRLARALHLRDLEAQAAIAAGELVVSGDGQATARVASLYGLSPGSAGG